MASLTRDELLILLVEECGEIIQAATKCLRFGYDSDHGIGYGKNDVALARECGDILAVINALPLDGDVMAISRHNKIGKAVDAKAKFGKPIDTGTTGERG